jgi:preprotein translocase subunit SecA
MPLAMRSGALSVPGMASAPYPERPDTPRAVEFAWSSLRAPARVERHRQARFLARVHAHDQALRTLSDSAWQSRLQDLRARLAASGFTKESSAEAFALVREATRRQLGTPHYDTQLIAGRIMLGNQLAEMATGEGKTLAAALTAATAALAGIPVHVITANDYLVARDAHTLGPVYKYLGLKVGAVTQPLDQGARRSAYGCHITYCTAKELVFDYLRDRLVRRETSSHLHERVRQLENGAAQAPALLLRGLCMALIDEADSILIDEARTPFILSQTRVNDQQQTYFKEALRIAMRLRPGADFRLDAVSRNATLTDSGRERLGETAATIGGLWQDRRHREEVITLALAARQLYVRDRDYLVREGKILMIDQTTGRVAPGRVWSKGLHQLLEVKEGCAPTGEMETIAQITYQRFFPRYLRLCGMSGTLTEAADELRSVYRLSISRVPLRKPSRRATLPSRVCAWREQKWDAVIERVRALAAESRPVLIGTDSVADTDQLSYRLTAHGFKHAVLNARNDQEEADIVARAGHPDHITVTTNMAGRGTDIPLGPGVAGRGGLHVICCQHNASRRIDRQLQGRCARQGDPGSVETILSLEDPLIVQFWPGWLRSALRGRAAGRTGLPWWLTRLVARLPQMREERRQRGERRLLLQQDQHLERRLSFAGRGE